MLIHQSGDPTGLAILIGSRSLIDSDLGKVLENNPVLRQTYGENYTRRCLRIALREYGEGHRLEMAELKALRQEVLAECDRHGIRTLLTIGKVAFWCIHQKRADLMKWVGAPRTLDGRRVLHTFAPWELAGMYRPVLFRHLQRARDLHEGRLIEHPWPETIIYPGPQAATALEGILSLGEPVGFDVETAGKDARRAPLTAIGIANRHVAVSMPWDEYSSGKYGHVRGIRDYSDGPQCEVLVRAVLNSEIGKIAHNGSFDGLVMRARGIEFNGRLDDTLLLHRVLAENLKHGLQFVATCELPVSPWKSTFKDEDSASFVEVPEEDLRHYNAKDAAVEVPLYDALRKQL